MAIWGSTPFQNGGLNYLKTTATFLTLIKAYALGDNLATITANKVAESAMVNGDFAITTPVAGTQRVTSAAKAGISITADSVAGANTHWAFHDGTNVIYVTKETTAQQFTSGNLVNFPALYVEMPQPTIIP